MCVQYIQSPCRTSDQIHSGILSKTCGTTNPSVFSKACHNTKQGLASQCESRIQILFSYFQYPCILSISMHTFNIHVYACKQSISMREYVNTQDTHTNTLVSVTPRQYRHYRRQEDRACCVCVCMYIYIYRYKYIMCVCMCVCVHKTYMHRCKDADLSSVASKNI